MEIVYDIIALLIVISVGYISEEKRSYFLFLLGFLVPAGLLMGYFLQDIMIYGLLFVLGISMEKIYIKYKWPVTKRPKSADYKPANDWLMKIVATLIIILCIDMVSEASLLYTFGSFFLGILLSFTERRIRSFQKGPRI